MTGFQIPRNSLAWMLVAQIAVIAPHLTRLPVWTIALCVLCVLWRVMVYQGRWSYPGRLIKVLFVFFGIVGLAVGYGTFLGLDPWVGLLIMMYVLKLLEMHHKRDGYVVILLGYFVALTQFLYDQGIPSTLYVFLCVTMITAALIGLNQTQSHLQPLQTFRKATVLLLQSVPLMVVLFVLFPRISPLWTVPLQTDIARTGVTDSMTPGSIASLTQSDELAFRATFAGEVPPLSKLYWRGLVLSRFDGETWTQERLAFYGRLYRPGQPTDWQDNMELLGDEVRYSILLEPTSQNWLFSLTMPEGSDKEGIGLVRDFRFYSFREIRSKLRYDLTSHLNYRIDRKLSDFWRYRYTLLPKGSNPRSARLARSLFQDSPNQTEYIRNILRRYNQDEFVYTLKPPVLGDDSIDEFLLDSKRGFCEHYAGSFVFLMRSVGIPARVVVGYQGGEYNRIGNYVEVRQFDAHAWTEVWQEGQGWVRIDPTSAVAPERIESGLESAVEDENTFLANLPLSWMKYRQTLWLTEIRLQLSAISHYWDSWVVGYTPSVQMSLLTRYFGDLDAKRLGMMMLTAFFGLLGIVAIFVLGKRSHKLLQPIDREYLRFCQMMAKKGIPRSVGEGPIHYAERIGQLNPELALVVNAVTDAYILKNYAEDKPEKADSLRAAIRSFRLKSVVSS
jgi:protein-glutamine gamma-glutamyltransferase